MGETECPKSEIGSSVRNRAQSELDSFDQLMDENLAEILMMLLDLIVQVVVKLSGRIQLDIFDRSHLNPIFLDIILPHFSVFGRESLVVLFFGHLMGSLFIELFLQVQRLHKQHCGDGDQGDHQEKVAVECLVRHKGHGAMRNFSKS